MTNIEFNKWLYKEIAKHPMLAKSNPKSVNEFSYILRMSEYDFCLNITDGNGAFTCVPSVKECFIPSRILAQKIKSIEYDEETFDEYESRLIIIEVEGE